MKRYKIYYPIVMGLFLFPSLTFAQGPKWYQDYQAGLKAMALQDWQSAAQKLQQALQGKDKDKNKQRAMGTIFVEYYPHRELGICYFHLGQIDLAKNELTLSLQHEYSNRAKEYLNRINRGDYPNAVTELQPVKPPTQPETKPDPSTQKLPLSSGPPTIVGERLSIAVLPFESRGFSGEIGDMDLLDKMITGFVNAQRFKVIERAQLEKIIAEQKLGLTGILDATTAAEVGRGIGVDAVVVGSVTRARNSLSIDARLIDTETATIISAKDAYSDRIDMQNISQMVSELAKKIKNDLPIVNGFIININGDKFTIDIGRKNAIKKGMKCIVYREGDSIVHPVSGEVIGKMIDELCEIQITDIFDAYSIAVLLKVKSGVPKKLDKIITK